MLTQITSSNNLIRQRVRSSDRAFRAIDESRKILSQLERFVIETAEGGYPDVATIGAKTSDLRHQIDEILVGLIEARTVQEDSD